MTQSDSQQSHQKLGLLWPSLLTLLGLAILIGLGTWQMGRKVEKDAIISRLHSRAEAAPVSLDEVIARSRDGDVEYTRVEVHGILHHEKERYLYAPHQGYGPGYDVFAPMQVGEKRYVWVNLGYVPERFKSPDTRPAGGGAEDRTIIGVVRLSAKQETFTPDNNVADNLWYWRDLAGMHASAFDPSKTDLVPFFIEAEPVAGGVPAAEWPKPGTSKVKIFNRHFEYALTWYGLALTLLGVYVAFVWHRLESRRTPE